ncbi:hypothetical protein Hanom_Chr12g01155901 [Helianthus anomalus]
MPNFVCIYRVIVVDICEHAMIIMLQVLMSSSKSGLSDEHDPMAVVSDDEVAPEPEVFTSDTESDPDMISDDEDDFQPLALLDFGNDIPDADILIDDVFVLPAPVHDYLIIGHPDGEHIVAPILDVVPLIVIQPEDWPFDDLFDDDVDLFVGNHPAGEQGDGEVGDVVVVDVPPPAMHVTDISSDSSLHSVVDSFESVTSSALRAAGLHLYATDDDDATSAAPSSPEIPAPRPREGTSSQPPSFDPFATADFPPIPQFPPVVSSPLDEPFRWFPPYMMPISDPYHPSQYGGYTRDELLLSLQLQFEILSRRVLELEFGEGASR